MKEGLEGKSKVQFWVKPDDRRKLYEYSKALEVSQGELVSILLNGCNINHEKEEMRNSFKELRETNKELRKANDELRETNEELKETLISINDRLNKLEQK
jgi:predicted nuclease with TOPRIM domain